MGYIYKITNDINDKVYVGQTIKTPAIRWNRHKHNYYKQFDGHRLLYEAMQQYGIDHFSISTIEEVDNDNLDTREEYWINTLNSYGNGGYNCTSGGEKERKIDHDAVVKYFTETLNITQTAKHFCISKTSITTILNEHNIHFGHKKYVAQYDKNGKFVKLHNSPISAAESLGMDTKIDNAKACISNACRRCGESLGYMWKYVNPYFDSYTKTLSIEYVENALIASARKHAVDRYDLNGVYIDTFKSVRDAGIAVGAKSAPTSISAVCSGKKISAYGFKWKYANNDIPRFKRSSK